MDRKATVIRNGAASVVQVLINAAALVVLYPYVINAIGAEAFGIWALVMSWTSAAGIGNLGLNGGAAKFTSQYLARGDYERTRDVAQTASLSVAGILAVVLVLAYPAFLWLLGVLLEDPAHLEAGHRIAPYTFLSFWLTSIAYVFMSCVDGCHKMSWRSGVQIGATLAYLALCFVLVPAYGLEGFVAAQIAQAGLLMAGSWVLLRRALPGLPVVPYRWRKPVFRETLSYSLNFQLVSVFIILMEPVTKALLTRFAGVGTVTPFEAAQKMAVQLRALVVTAHTAVVPAIADLQEVNPGRIRDIYKVSFKALLLFIALALPALAAATPLISRVWLGAYNHSFVVFSLLLLTGWFLNMLTNPAYFANMGTGHLGPNVRGHATMGVLNVLLGGSLGYLYGSTGVVVGFVLALLSGSFYIAYAYEREHGISWRELAGREAFVLAAAGLIGTALCFYLYARLGARWDLPWLIGLLGASYAACVALPLWRALVRGDLREWLPPSLTNRLPAGKPAQTNA